MHVSIGILSSYDDIHAIAVKQKIAERHPEATCHLIPGKELATKGGLSWSNEASERSVLRTTDDELIEIEELDAFWYRRLTMHQVIPDEADPHYAEHIHTSCWTALQGHLMTEFRGFWVSDPVATELGENKLLQLRAAQRAGLRVPATLVSQDPERIRSFCRAYPGAILKPLRARGELAVTAVASAELLAQDDVLSLTPAIYQENIPGDRHLRITMFGDRCHAALIEARELDWRTDVTVPFRAYEPAEQLRAALQHVLRTLGLVMGIFDLKLTPKGEIVFFEINPQGQFLFVEGLCNMPIAASLADYLVERAREHAATRGAAYI
jgi:glutathione synthase/RimK-type ligase-like ATP-grasp enzyme